MVMHGPPHGHVVFRGHALSQQHLHRQRTHRGAHHLHPGPGTGFQPVGQRCGRVVAHQVGLVHHDHVGAGDLVLEQLRQGRVMVEIVVAPPLGIDRGDGMGEPARGDGGAIDHGHDTVHGHAGADIRPAEGRHQRLRQCEPGGFDDDVLGRHVAVQQLFQRRHEILGHGAADAAVRQFHHVLIGAAFDSACLQDVAIDAQITEFVDDECDTPPARMGQHVADQRGLAGTEKAGDHGGRDLRSHGIVPCKGSDTGNGPGAPPPAQLLCGGTRIRRRCAGGASPKAGPACPSGPWHPPERPDRQAAR